MANDRPSEPEINAAFMASQFVRTILLLERTFNAGSVEAGEPRRNDP